jgi:hypothetical protein
MANIGNDDNDIFMKLWCALFCREDECGRGAESGTTISGTGASGAEVAA